MKIIENRLLSLNLDTNYYYGNNGNLIKKEDSSGADFDVNGNIIARYIQNPTVLDEPISIQTGSGKYYYLFDGLGSVTGLTDTGGNLVATYGYDAFGNIVSETGDQTLNAINPYRFTSRVYDKESGLYYYRARYYDSKTGRFTQKDPLREEVKKGENLYVYVGNNPVNRVDPTGLGWVKWLKYKVCFWGWCRWIPYGVEVWWERSELSGVCNLPTLAAITSLRTLISIIIGVKSFLLGLISTMIIVAMCIYYHWGCRWIYLQYIFGALMPIPLAKW